MRSGTVRCPSVRPSVRASGRPGGRPSVRPSRFGRILSPPRVLIRAQRNLANLLRTIFSKKCWKWNFDFLPLKFFMGVQSQNWVNFGHFWRFSARHSVGFHDGAPIFSKLNLLHRCHHLAKSEFQNFKLGRFGGDLKFQNFGSKFFFSFFGFKIAWNV